MDQKLVDLTEANFEREVLGARNPVLVHFWASWSEACKAMTPVLETVAQELPVKFAAVNIERNENLTEQYGVRAVPTLLLFNQGGLRHQIVGRATEQEVREALDRVI